jgi:RimJ/RimL family protein N-acetyltransferase
MNAQFQHGLVSNTVPSPATSSPEVMRETAHNELGEGLTIRLATADDLDALVRMYVAFEPKVDFQGLPPPTRDKIVKWLSGLLSESNVNFVIEAGDGRAVGHAMLCRGPSDRAEFAIFLHQDYRGKGLGEKLTEAVVHFGCQCLHLKRIWLAVQTLNFPAVSLYRKLGFVVVEDLGDFASELIMERGVGCPVCKHEQCPVFEKKVPVGLRLS